MTLRFQGRLAILCALFAVVGCGGSDGPKVVSVKGKVTVGGSEPFENGLVLFAPKTPGKYLGGSATTDDQGNYVLKHVTNKTGIEPGEYNVSFSLMKLPDGSPLPEQPNPQNPKTPQELGGVQFVPIEYSAMTSAKNPTTVPAAGGTFNFDIPELKPQGKAKGR